MDIGQMSAGVTWSRIHGQTSQQPEI